MLTLEQIIQGLSYENLTHAADKCKLTRPFLSAIKNGHIKNPSYDTVKKLSDYLENKEV